MTPNPLTAGMSRYSRIIALTIISVMLTTLSSVASPRFSLITIGPGSEVYLLEGHTALRVIDDNGRDMTVNWGMFDFNDPGFALKFARGDTDYWVASTPTSYFIEEYRRAGRQITEQPLQLSPEMADTLMSLINDNLLPQNRVYRYRYLTDNCATRPLALIERAVTSTGGQIEVASKEGDAQPATWRSELRGYHHRHPLYQLFIDIALGGDIDRQVTDRERAFAPVYLSDYAARLSTVDHEGIQRPLVTDRRIIAPERPGVTGSEPSPWLIVAPILLISLAMMIIQWRRQRLVWRGVTAGLFVVLMIPASIVTFLTLASTQEATGNNLNILWLNPLTIAPPLLIWTRPTRRLLTPLMWLNGGLTLLWLLVMPFVNQSPGAVVTALALSDLMLTTGYLAGAGQLDRCKEAIKKLLKQ